MRQNNCPSNSNGSEQQSYNKLDKKPAITIAWLPWVFMFVVIDLPGNDTVLLLIFQQLDSN
ncbi:MAG: hypothetical protein ABI472_11290 [Ginsengibacter sp.]